MSIHGFSGFFGTARSVHMQLSNQNCRIFVVQNATVFTNNEKFNRYTKTAKMVRWFKLYRIPAFSFLALTEESLPTYQPVGVATHNAPWRKIPS